MLRQRLAAFALILAFLGLSIGIPLPRPMAPKSNEDFPCRYHACGCLNAEMCRTQCCCHKPATTTATRSCCSKKSKADCDEPAADSPKEKDSTTHGIVITAMQCKGISLGLCLITLVIHPADSTLISRLVFNGEQRNVAPDRLIPLNSVAPLDPPPRLA